MSYSRIITHRGANKYAPQNTLPAFKKAVEIGTDGFETDVHITKDGKIVLCHNYTIDEKAMISVLISAKNLKVRKFLPLMNFSPLWKQQTSVCSTSK